MTKGGPTMQQQQVCTASRYFRQGQRQATSEQVHRRGQHELPSVVGNGNRGDGNGSVPPNSHEANGKDEPRGVCGITDLFDIRITIPGLTYVNPSVEMADRRDKQVP